MSFDAKEARRFLEPLKGKLSIFSVRDRDTNLLLAQSICAAARALEEDCKVLDPSAFYSVNSPAIFSGSRAQAVDRVMLFLPEVGSELEGSLVEFVSSGKAEILVVDNLNTLFHLLSVESSSRAVRSLVVFAAFLSHFARTNQAAVVATVYQRDRAPFAGRQRLFSELGDVSINAQAEREGLSLRSEGGKLWTTGRFLLSRPSR